MGNYKLLKGAVLHVAQSHDKEPRDNSPRLTSLLPTSLTVIHEARLPPSGMCVVVSPDTNMPKFRANMLPPSSGYKTKD